jgi:hypothetical protein
MRRTFADRGSARYLHGVRSVALFVVAALAIATAARADDDPLATLVARTDAIAREVARVRDLPLRRKVKTEIVDRDELRARMGELANEPKAKAATAAEGLVLARFGLIPINTDYPQLVVDLLAEQVAGYYDAEHHALAISRTAGDDLEWAEMVLAHELDHALQDQSFGLKTFEDVPDAEADAALARHALVEGDGVATMIEVALARRHVAAPWSDPRVAARLAAAMDAPERKPGGSGAIDRAPLAVREAMVFPYRAGLVFVAALRRHRTWSAVDAAFKRPPRSTEQILHVDRYVADKKPVAVAIAAPAALPGYAIVASTVWGEFGFDVFLRAHGVDATRAARAADGWSGDRVVVLAKAGDARPDHTPASPAEAIDRRGAAVQRTVGIARTRFDTEVDAIEAHEAAVAALDRTLAGGTVDSNDQRTRWLALDGTAAWVERRGQVVVLVIGAPATAADALAAELWAAPTKKK